MVKAGDFVKCIDNTYTHLSVGKKYKIQRVIDGWYVIVNNIGYEKEYHPSIFG